MKETPTRLDYEIDDLTGPPLEVKQFVDNDVRILTDPYDNGYISHRQTVKFIVTGNLVQIHQTVSLSETIKHVTKIDHVTVGIFHT